MALVSRPRISTPDEHATELLRDRGITVKRVVRVCPDSILYLGGTGRPMTAWLHLCADGKLEICYEPGFAAERHPELVPRHVFYPSRESARDDMDQA